MGGDPLPHTHVNPPDPIDNSNEPSQPPDDGIPSIVTAPLCNIDTNANSLRAPPAFTLAFPCDTIPLEVQDADMALGAGNVTGSSENLTESAIKTDRVDNSTNTTRSQNIYSHDRIYEPPTVNISGVVSKRVREVNTYAQHRKFIQLGDDDTMAERTRISVPDETSAAYNADPAGISTHTPPHQAVHTLHRRSVRVRRATDHY